MRKIILILILLLTIGLVACTTPEKEDGNNGDNQPFIVDNQYTDYAIEQLKNINEHLRHDNSHLLFPDMLAHTAGNHVANLWDFGAYFTGVIRTYKIHRTEETKVYFDQAMMDLEWYKAKNRDDDHLVYASQNGNETPAFYDDNVWLVIGLLEAYEFTENKVYLDIAEKVQEWIYASWQTAFGGGLLWREFPKNEDPAVISRNTCINAPAAYAAARFYQLTESQSHLNWAKRIFGWTQQHLFDSNLNVYLDNINQLGQVQNMIFTYNTGVMISAAALLYDITGDNAYQAHALEIIEGGRVILSKPHINTSVKGDFYKDNTWFNLYFYQGLLDATRYLDETDSAHEYMQKAIQAFDFSYPRFKDKFGLALEKWDASGYNQAQQDNFRAATLYASGNLETMGIFAEYVHENSDLFK